MHTTHTVHIRGAQPWFFSSENQSNPIFPRLCFFLLKGTCMFFFTEGKKYGRKKNHRYNPLQESTLLNVQILYAPVQ